MKPIKPMLLTKGEHQFCADFLYQFKFDGVRILAYNFERPQLFNRKTNERTLIYPEIVSDLANLPKGIVLDGEVIALNKEGKPDFYLTLQRDLVKSYKRNDISVCLIVFDILYCEGRSVMELPLVQRQLLLEQVTNNKLEHIKLIDSFSEGELLFKTAKELDMEGIVAKRRDSVYIPDFRSKDWIKIKCFRQIETVVGGFLQLTRPSLYLGVKQGDKLFYVGNVSNGLKSEEFDKLLSDLKGLETQDCPFIAPVKGARYVKPLMNVSIQYLERTPSGTLRQPVIIKVY